ncbi:glycosyltransferase [Pseudoduganella sp. UC29_106]|uniref:glycosyltransferase n=1 Tax=Pseudoduganella sp. UC29_106 TaxID=3374553 RepID=UPI00375780D2
MIHVLLSQAGGYRDIIAYLAGRGARVTVIGPEPREGIRGKKEIVRAMLSPRVLRTRGLWTREDRVLIVGWQALPVLALIKAGVLPRPARLLVMGCFIHGEGARRVVNRAWKTLRFPGLGFITFSPGETRNLIDEVGMPADSVHYHLWRQELDGQAQMQAEDGSIFAGGFSNRDYDLLLQAAEPLPAPLVIVASARNAIAPPSNEHTTIHRDLPEGEFEDLLARSTVVAMPLRSQGEACGQSVLLRVLRNGKPLVATRHESIEEYLGADYPGFVPHNDVTALRTALASALEQPGLRAVLSERIREAGRKLEQRGEPGAEIEEFLLA